MGPIDSVVEPVGNVHFFIACQPLNMSSAYIKIGVMRGGDRIVLQRVAQFLRVFHSAWNY